MRGDCHQERIAGLGFPQSALGWYMVRRARTKNKKLAFAGNQVLRGEWTRNGERHSTERFLVFTRPTPTGLESWLADFYEEKGTPQEQVKHERAPSVRRGI